MAASHMNVPPSMASGSAGLPNTMSQPTRATSTNAPIARARSVSASTIARERLANAVRSGRDRAKKGRVARPPRTAPEGCR